MSDSELNPDFFGSYKTVFKLWKAHLLNELAEVDLPMASISTLFMIKRMQPVKSSELAEEMQVSKSAVTQVVENLLQYRLVEKVEDESDRRVSRISLSKLGEDILKPCEEQRIKLVELVSSVLTEEEMSQTTEINQKIINALKG